MTGQSYNYENKKFVRNNITASGISSSLPFTFMEDRNAYYVPLPSGVDVFRNIMSDLGNINSIEVRKLALEFIQKLRSAILALPQFYKASVILSPLKINESEDGSVLLEWNFRDFRFGFSIDEEIANSYWYLVTNRKLEELSVSGDLDVRDADEIIFKTLKYVLENT